MKVTLERVLTETVEVELPENCPGCGANFKNKNEYSLIEEQWAESSQACLPTFNDENPFEYGPFINKPGDCIITGYACAKCDLIIVSTDDDEDEIGNVHPEEEEKINEQRSPE